MGRLILVTNFSASLDPVMVSNAMFPKETQKKINPPTEKTPQLYVNTGISGILSCSHSELWSAHAGTSIAPFSGCLRGNAMVRSFNMRTQSLF